jgi:ATP-dependent Clp protease ATP-binding subunit ClpB
LAEQKIQIALTDAAKEYLSNVGYDPSFGARPLRRVIQRQVVNQLAREILNGTVLRGQMVEVDYNGEQIVFEGIEQEVVNGAEVQA